MKICGVTTVADTLRVVELGADLIGLNFHAPSPRHLEIEAAAAIVREVSAAPAFGANGRERPLWVGVFVDRPAAEVDDVARRVGLDLVQLHGDEAPAEVAPLAARAIKAFRVERDLAEVDLAPWLELGLWGFLVDARAPDVHGGSGRRWDVATFAGSPLAARRTLVAGGLDPETIADAARIAAPWGLDVCSGVESRPGRKDPDRLHALFQEIDHGTSSSAA
ncbi:MAG: phosphoribosylanthranilate isomerase [Acidobacteriota bacterium]